MPQPIHSPRLSTDDVHRYQEEGYLIFNQPVLPEPAFNELRATFETLLADLPGDERPEAMDVPHFLYPQLFKYAFAKEILDLVEPIIGPDIGLFSTHFICKPTGNGKRVPWHEDSAYWKGKIEPMEVCTVWLAIDPSTRENGCMMVIPNTHRTGRKGYSDYEDVDTSMSTFSTEILESQRTEDAKVYLELQPNQCSLHDARIIHGSEPNTSRLRRCGWTLRFMPTTSFFDHEKYGKTHQIYLARGKDHAGNHYADPTKSYPDLALYRTKHMKNAH